MLCTAELCNQLNAWMEPSLGSESVLNWEKGRLWPFPKALVLQRDEGTIICSFFRVVHLCLCIKIASFCLFSAFCLCLKSFHLLSLGSDTVSLPLFLALFFGEKKTKGGHFQFPWASLLGYHSFSWNHCFRIFVESENISSWCIGTGWICMFQ